MKYNSYSEFEKEKSKCNKCPIGLAYNKVVLSDGNKLNPKVVFIGEAPGSDEIEFGKPFVGKSGKLLRLTIDASGLQITDYLITNTIPCRPLDNKFPSDETIIINCKNRWLKEEILLTKPDIIVLVGAKAMKFILGIDGITKNRGKLFNRKILGKQIKIMPIYHPSYVLRKEYMEEGKQIKKDFQDDIATVAKIAKPV